MNETIYMDLACGISGDMLLAALVDSGVPEEIIRKELALIPLHDYTLEFLKEKRCALNGLRAVVQIEHKHHQHRKHSDIASMISSSRLSDEVKSLSLRVFQRLAVAEAKVHGTTPEDVEFHEVGAVDSIVDIIACSAAISFISPDSIFCGIPVLGTGTITTAHGTMPLPAPATVELLRDFPVKLAGIGAETVTPTGAAFLAELAKPLKETPAMRIMSVGHGFGSRKEPVPNMLRIIRCQANAVEMSEAVLIETNIDDMNPQVYPHVITRLLESGAHDAWITPIIMKHGRPGSVLSALVQEELADKTAEIIFSETTSVGLRYKKLSRITLERRHETVQTQYGPIRIKVAHMDGKIYNYLPEYADCVSVSNAVNMPLKEVSSAALAAFRKK